MRTKTKTVSVTFANLADYQKTLKIYLDDSFQSNSRWSITEKQDYLSSVLEGRAVTSIILAKLDSIIPALELAFGKDNEDYLFFKELQNKGYEYVTIDGNNRDRCISEFVEGGFPLTQREYEIDDDGGLKFFTAKKENKYYSKLPADVKHYVENIKMNVLVVTQADRVGLANLFIAVNKGMNLNAQEKRNAIMCAFGESVRDLSKTLNKGFSKVYNEKSLNRRFSDEMIVTAATIIANGIDNVTTASRDAAYTDTSKELSVFKKKVIPIMTDIVDSIISKYGASAINIGAFDSGNFIDLIMLINYMYDKSIKIENYKAFNDWFILSQSERVDNTDILYEGSKGTNKRTYSGLLRGTGKAFLTIRLNMLIESLSTIPDNVLTFRDEKRAFDYKLRYKFWKRQNGICPLSQNKIEPTFIWDTKITHIDHDMPWSKSGETSEENGQLTFAKSNLAKSNNIFALEAVSEEL